MDLDLDLDMSMSDCYVCPVC